jgi:hypothetical protein
MIYLHQHGHEHEPLRNKFVSFYKNKTILRIPLCLFGEHVQDSTYEKT